MTPSNRVLLLASAWAIALLAAGCGGSPASSPPPDYEKALADAPAPLARLYDRGNELLPGGKDAFDRRLEALRGYPIVANVWASWCGNCLHEFPLLQKASARFGDRVAFVGVDSEDSEDSARSWLEDNPVPYPSYVDADADVARSYRAVGLPVTVFYDADGNVVSVKQGAYRDESELVAEIKEHALGSS